MGAHRYQLRQAIMDIRKTLEQGQSKTNCNKIVHWIGDDAKRFNILVQLFLLNDLVIAQRAGWPLSDAVRLHPHLANKHLQKIIGKLDAHHNHEAVKRNVVRILQYVSIPKKLQGAIMDRCFNYILSPTEKPAVKAFSLTELENLAEQYPEIQPELVTIINDRWAYETAAFHSRGKKILKRFASKTH